MGSPIRVSVVRVGGVAGVKRTATVDTETLDETRAGELRRLVEEANIAHVSEPTIRSTREKDRFHFTLTVQQGAFHHSLTFSEEGTPEQVQPLLEMVWREGQPDMDDTKAV
ncbi:MAG: protealysin inhibitor emfourin [Vicinamibacteria bacterium]